MLTASKVMRIRNNPNDYDLNDPVNWKEIQDCINDALERQIPMEPDDIKIELESIGWTCRRCGYREISDLDDSANYCSVCGQKILIPKMAKS